MKSTGSRVIGVIGPTASGKSARAVALALERGGEVISVDSRQVYRLLDIGTEKIVKEEMGGVPHHLIDIRDPKETYSAGDFVADASRLIEDIQSRGKVPILAGGTHFYFDALLYGLPETAADPLLRAQLETLSTEDLFAQAMARDPHRAKRLDPRNRRRLIRALEIANTYGRVPERTRTNPCYDVEWVTVDLPRDELRERITQRLEKAFERGLVEEVERVCAYVGDTRLTELGLEYRMVGEYLRNERALDSLLPALSSKLWHYARHQKSWLKRLTT